MGLLAAHARVFSCCCVWILCCILAWRFVIMCYCFPTGACLTIAAADLGAGSSRRGIRASHGRTPRAPGQNITSIAAMQVLRSLRFDYNNGEASEDRVICMHSALKKSNSSKQAGKERNITIDKVEYLERWGGMFADCIVHRIDPHRRRSTRLVPIARGT